MEGFLELPQIFHFYHWKNGKRPQSVKKLVLKSISCILKEKILHEFFQSSPHHHKNEIKVYVLPHFPPGALSL